MPPHGHAAPWPMAAYTNKARQDGRVGLPDELQLQQVRAQVPAPTEEEGYDVHRLGGFHVTGVPAYQ